MRPPNFVDLTGLKFGRLTPMEYLGSGYWLCMCDCGVLTKKRGNHVREGASKSCGCYNKELMHEKFKTHGLSKHPLMAVHHAMLSRCYNKKQKAYKYYGGKGVGVCERWHTFKNFYDDMVVGYRVGLSIERADVSGNYEPLNCRWATHHEQVRNRTDNVFIEYNGIRMIMADWATELGMDKRTLWNRLKLGWPIERAFLEPVKLGRR